MNICLNGCNNLKYIKVGFTAWQPSGESAISSNWVNGVSSTGTFEAPEELPVQFGVSRIPTGWDVPNGKYIIASNQTFTGKVNEEVEFYIDCKSYPEDLQKTFTIIEGEENLHGFGFDDFIGCIYGSSEEAFTGSFTVRISAEGCKDVDIVINILIVGENDIDPTGLFLYHPLTETLSVLPTGQSVTGAANTTIETVDGLTMTKFSSTYNPLIVQNTQGKTISQPFSISFKFNRGTEVQTCGFLGLNQYNLSFRICLLQNGKIQITLTGGQNGRLESKTLYNTSTDNHTCTLVVANNQEKLYMDGVLDNSTTYSTQSFTLFDANLQIGATSTNTGTQFEGYMSDLRFYERELTEEEILFLANN